MTACLPGYAFGDLLQNMLMVNPPKHSEALLPDIPSPSCWYITNTDNLPCCCPSELQKVWSDLDSLTFIAEEYSSQTLGSVFDHSNTLREAICPVVHGSARSGRLQIGKCCRRGVSRVYAGKSGRLVKVSLNGNLLMAECGLKGAQIHSLLLRSSCRQ